MPLRFLFLFFFVLPSFPAKAAESTIVGEACSGSLHRADWDAIFQCASGAWKRAALWLGASGDACNSSKAGILQWTGTTFQGCDGTSWISLGGGSGSCPTITSGSITFTSNGTFNPTTYSLAPTPSCPVQMRVVVVGGGQGGLKDSTSGGRGGNSGGHYATIVNLISSSAITVTVGAGGTANGGAGGNSSFKNIMARGGSDSYYSNAGGGGQPYDGDGGCAAGGANGSKAPLDSYDGYGKTVRGLLFSSATLGSGAGGGLKTAIVDPCGGGGGAGGFLLNAAGPTAATGAGSFPGGGGRGYGSGGGGGTRGANGGAGAAGVVYVEWGY